MDVQRKNSADTNEANSPKRKWKDEKGLAVQAQKRSLLKFVRHENNEVDQDHQVTAQENFYAEEAQEMQQHTEQSFETDADTKQQITTVETVLAWDIDDIGAWLRSLNNEFRAIILERGPGRIKGLEYPKDIREEVLRNYSSPKMAIFLGLIQLLGKFDTVMSEHLRRVTENEIHDHCLEPRIQNELIMLMSDKVRDKSVSLVTLAKYFAVILDCTPDVSHREHTSLVVRFVDISDSAQITVKESFITFLEVEDTTGFGLLQALLDDLKRMGLSVMNIRGQGYDNGANMRGCISGVQARLLAENPRAFFVPCACHSLI
nr:zinc finger MYM-type protein 1-like [Caretta caretta]